MVQLYLTFLYLGIQFYICFWNIVFIFVNGADPEMFLNVCYHMRLLRDISAINHIRYLFRVFTDYTRYDHYYAWNVINERYECIHGSPVINRLINYIENI